MWNTIIWQFSLNLSDVVQKKRGQTEKEERGNEGGIWGEGGIGAGAGGAGGEKGEREDRLSIILSVSECIYVLVN